MSEQRFCRRCHNPLNEKRGDKEFCTDKCAAAWAREQGYYRTRFHEEKPEWIKKNCEQCGTIFEYNEYAMRGGQRVPKYCSNSCRQAAYRERKAAAGQHAGYTGNWDDARQDKTDTKANKGTSQGKGKTWSDYEKQGQQKQGKGTSQDNQKNQENKGTQQPHSDKGTSQTHEKRWSSNNVYEILGVTYHSTYEEIKKAWKKLLRTYHPDISKHPDATYISQRVNFAWSKIEESHRKG